MNLKSGELVIAVQPYTRGFGFALFVAPLSPVDWGTKVIRSGDRDALSVAAVEKLISLWHPEVLLLMDYGKAWPAPRIERLHEQIGFVAAKMGVPTRRYGRKQIQACFAGVGAVSRYQIAQAIASRISAFSDQLPPPRKPWDPEDPHMNMFDAIALVMTYYSSLEKSPENRL